VSATSFDQVSALHARWLRAIKVQLAVADITPGNAIEVLSYLEPRYAGGSCYESTRLDQVDGQLDPS
jgi:hypothetical protein